MLQILYKAVIFLTSCYIQIDLKAINLQEDGTEKFIYIFRKLPKGFG